ncbi:fimbrial protein [Erwinia sp. E602]|uniref:fimbrial protein n=1 Tax=Erwinia sp. E602 TaxID=2675378 RepID=UPI001BAC41CB|nr:fimbrial protein [Erwinia sp. E602]QUG77791.1 fimbrial protein [Erwinia sp. E602]
MSFLLSNTFCIAPLMLAVWSLCPLAMATQQEEGTVNMQGTIINSACTIAMKDLQQSISLGTLPVSSLVSLGRGTPQRFTIHLIHCMLDHTDARQRQLKGFQTTFEGSGRGSLFTLQGTASGVALQIGDDAGNIATTGKALPVQTVSPDQMQLRYFLTPVRNQQPLIAGDYFATIRFRLDYF